MGLTQAQRALIERAKAAGGGELGTGLSDEACSYLLAIAVRDLEQLDLFPELKDIEFPEFFEEADPRRLLINDLNFYALIERLVGIVADADTFFSCLASLQKSRLKYARILEKQPLPTMDQVGPRALLQYGQMNPKALVGFLLWRKWIYDIDNRAAQETGYLFEPIIAAAIGGTPISAKKSPIKRYGDSTKGRQVDCVRNSRAYEIKLRVTIAASGQGRWAEELAFPIDCRASNYTPVLIVLDSTANPKLAELARAFLKADGEVYIGDEAWKHLEEAAGSTMAKFLEKYVRSPLQDVLESSPTVLPNATFKMTDTIFSVLVGKDYVEFPRSVDQDVFKT